MDNLSSITGLEKVPKRSVDLLWLFTERKLHLSHDNVFTSGIFWLKAVSKLLQNIQTIVAKHLF